jgi:hypothetical protein
VHRDASAWLASLPADLARQKELILRLLNEVEKDERMRLFIVGCSIGRGAADRLSDVDALICVSDAAWPDVIAESGDLVRRIGAIVDQHAEVMTGTSDRRAWQHTFAQYADGAQVDLAITPVPARRAPAHDWVVLYDPDQLIQGEPTSGVATTEQVRGWMFNAFHHLSACVKYLTRGSLWEAELQLGAARADLWRLWAAAEGVPDPQYGLTAVLDRPGTPLPRNIDMTTAPLEPAALARAANVCAELLIDIWPRSVAKAGGDAPAMPPLADWVRTQLKDLET